MTGMMIGDLMRETMIVILKMGGPLMLIGLIVGVIVSIIQALTQIQEQSLTFVPKLLAIFAGLLIFMSYIGSTLMQFSEQIFLKMTQLE